MNARLISAFVSVTMLALMASSTIAYAQDIPSQNGVDLTASLDNPEPGQDITITAQSYSTDINAANVTWTVNGRVVQHGIGLTAYSLRAPALGKTTVVDVRIVSPDGISFENALDVASGFVDFIVEPDGYAPPYFPGKLPVSYQNVAKIIAVPHLANPSGVEYDPSSLIYKWQQGTNVLVDQSGYGKQSIEIPGSIIPRSFQVQVDVTSRDGSAATSAVVNVDLSSPFILFYRNDPLYGPLYNQAVGSNLDLGTGRETQVLAVPFGFNVPTAGTGGLSLDWEINNSPHTELAKDWTITLRAPDGESGSSEVSLRIGNASDILQSALASFMATFDASSATTSQPIF